MSRFFKILLCLFLFLAWARPALASDACFAPQPSAIDSLITQVQAEGGAAALVPASVIKAVYTIEAFPYYMLGGSFACKKNQYTALGMWQIVDSEYNLTVPDKQRLDNDEQVCEETNCKLSRCHDADAVEIFSRAFLSKIQLWDDNKMKPLGRIETIENIMYAAGRYYGLFVPDTTTTNLIPDLPTPLKSEQFYPAGHKYADLSYPELVCALSGFCKTYKDYIDRDELIAHYINYQGAKSTVPFKFDACAQPPVIPPTTFDFHPLRPNPDEPNTVPDDSFLTTYCAMRATAVEQNRFDRRDMFINPMTIGTMTQDFTAFITPLLSITDPTKKDYTLPYMDKAQRYLADYLEGRAYYEPMTESLNDPAFLNQLEELLTPEEIAAIHTYGIDNIPDQQMQNSIKAKVNSGFMFNRLGVARKLMPMSQQDKLKRALIQRGNGLFDPGATASDSAYGFTPASVKVHNYVVGYWYQGNAYASNFNKGEKVSLGDYLNNWAPLPEDFPDGGYSKAYAAWQIADGGSITTNPVTGAQIITLGKWASLWPYVPMFSRDDTTGKIEIFDSNPPPEPYCPNCSKAEENTKSDKKTVEVSHPHLARTYEVSTTLSYLLTPDSIHDSSIPVEEWNGDPQNPPQTILKDEWTAKMWELSDWWLDPSYIKPHPTPLNSKNFTYVVLGPLCDLDPKYNTPVYSSGDPAYDDIIETKGKGSQDRSKCDESPHNEISPGEGLTRVDHCVPNEQYQGPASPQSCTYYDQGQTITIIKNLFPCEYFTNDCRINDSACFYYKQIRSNPTYFQTETPFLVQILNSTMLSGRGIFDLFKSYGAPPQAYEEHDWPGLGNEGEESPNYEYTANSGEHALAEAGTKKPGDSQGYYYRFLGNIQCAKERVMQVLQPFVTNETYKPFTYACFPELTPPPSPDTTPTGSRWLQWPMKDINQPLTQCFRDTTTGNTHAGIDMVGNPDGAPVYPGADGQVVTVSFSSVFGNYVIIHHPNSWNTIYAHLQPNILVHEGQQVTINNQLGFQDSTGTPSYSGPMQLHLHFGLSEGSVESDFYYLNTPIADPCAQIEGCTCDSTGK